MRGLLDVNVLVALFDADHPSHGAAHAWLAGSGAAGWASCPLTQNGMLRIMSQPAYPNPAPLADLMQRLGEAVVHPAHRFWADDISLLDADRFDSSLALTHRQLTDVYLLALAVKNKGRFVTFDGGIALSAVRGATARHLVVL
jgi:toxin-antitoxin system PIN domain toxin